MVLVVMNFLVIPTDLLSNSWIVWFVLVPFLAIYILFLGYILLYKLTPIKETYLEQKNEEDKSNKLN